MIKKLFFLLTLLFAFTVNAQYTSVINSNRPGFSESPYSVGTGVYQFESSIYFKKIPATPTFSNPQALGLNLLFRTSFLFDKLELNLNTSLETDKIAFKNIFTSTHTETGLSQFTLGAKYLVYTPTYADKKKEIRSWKKRHAFDWKRWIPHVGVYAGANFGSFLTDHHNTGGISPKVGILLQNEFSDKLRMVTNFYYDNIGTDFSEYSYIISGTYNFNDYWSGFAEMQTQFQKYEKKTNIGLGAAYLYSENLQFNGTVRGMFERETVGMYVGLGVSYRLDRHVDEYTEIDEFGNKIEDQEDPSYKENKGFFGRLFDKITGIFKKKDKEVELDLSEEEKKALGTDKEDSKPKRVRQKSILDDIAKEDKKEKKKTTKAEKKAAKKAEKEKRKAEKKAQKEKEREIREIEKAAKKAEKEKEKEKKRLIKEQEEEALQKAKEKRKLEKEIEKLEKDLKKEEEKEKKEKEKENNKDDKK